MKRLLVAFVALVACALPSLSSAQHARFREFDYNLQFVMNRATGVDNQVLVSVPVTIRHAFSHASGVGKFCVMFVAGQQVQCKEDWTRKPDIVGISEKAAYYFEIPVAMMAQVLNFVAPNACVTVPEACEILKANVRRGLSERQVQAYDTTLMWRVRYSHADFFTGTTDNNTAINQLHLKGRNDVSLHVNFVMTAERTIGGK